MRGCSPPANSVGAREIKNHSITPVKFNPSVIGGSVRHWVSIDARGRVQAASGPVRVQLPGLASYLFRWHDSTRRSCTAVTAIANDTRPGFATASDDGPGFVTVTTFNAQGQFERLGLSVAVIC